MATAWHRIDETFRSYLEGFGTDEAEFNGSSATIKVTLRNSFLEQQRQQRKQQDDSWYRVTGAISRPSSHAGAIRYNLFRFAASDGLYPDECDANTAFEMVPSPKETSKNIIKFSIVFQSLNAAGKFLDDVAIYVRQSRGMLRFCDDEGNVVGLPPMTPIARYPIAPQNKILSSHYAPQAGDPAPGSPVIDVTIETRSMSTMSSEDSTVDVTIVSRSDDVFRYQRIENSMAFDLADPEAAHIFPSCKCVGQYEWLDSKPFNRLALSYDLHVNFDGTGRGYRKTYRAFTIRPLRSQDGYSIARIDGVDCYEIPLEIVMNDNTKAEPLLTRLQNHVELKRNDNKRWTISGAQLRILYPTNRRIDLISEESEQPAANVTPELVTAVPGVNNLSDCWSNSPENLLSLEAAEIMEKCLLWNYEEALRCWSSLG
jgi:hypothetical protein